MFQKQSETTWLQLGLDNRNANHKIECTRSTNSTANGTIKLWKCKTKHNSHKTIKNLKEHSWLWSSIFWYEELALDIGWTFGDWRNQKNNNKRCAPLLTTASMILNPMLFFTLSKVTVIRSRCFCGGMWRSAAGLAGSSTGNAPRPLAFYSNVNHSVTLSS